jgi:hypothetical protein
VPYVPCPSRMQKKYLNACAAILRPAIGEALNGKLDRKHRRGHTLKDSKLSWSRDSATENALIVASCEKFVKSKSLSSKAALSAVFSAAKVSLNALGGMSASTGILGTKSIHIHLDRGDILVCDCERIRDCGEFLCQGATEHDKGKCLCLERPAYATSLLHEVHV